MTTIRTSRTVRLFLAAWLVALVALPTTAIAGQRVAELQHETRTKSLSARAAVDGRVVAIEGTGMEIEVRPGSGDDAVVEAELEYWSDDAEWMRVVDESYDVAVRETARRVEIDFGSMPERRSRGNLLRRIFGNSDQSWSLRVTVTVPEGTALEVENAYGPVDVHGIRGALTIDNSSGDVRVSDVRATRIHNAYADVEIEDAEGEVRVNASSSTVTVRRVRGGVSAVTSYAPLAIEDVEGDVEAEASSGDLTIRNVRGAVISRNTYAGADLADIRDTLDHETSSGDVRIERVGGAVQAIGSYGSMRLDTSGPAELRNSSGAVTAARVRGDLRITNSYAPVEVSEVDGDLVVDSSSAGVTAQGVSGGVQVVTSYDGVRLTGVGGAVIVRNSSGRVTVSGFSGAALQARHEIETSYAGIEVSWPAGAEVGVEARSTYGGISSEIGGQIEGSDSSSTHRLTLSAAAGAHLRLVATSGGITIRSR